MLYPRESESREVKDLGGVWRFRPDVKGIGVEHDWPRLGLPDAIPMPVPASFNDITQDARLRDHVGEVWYEREFFVPESWRDRRTVLRVGAACHRAAVWVNGKEVMTHKGGYLPFEAEISGAVKHGESNRVTIRVDNTLDWTTLPPGKVTTQEHPAYPGGYRVQEYQHDFFNYAGIHRAVRLYCTPKVFISDITVVTDFEVAAGGTRGLVKYEVELAGGDPSVGRTGGAEPKVRAALLYRRGARVVVGEGASGELVVEDAKLWRPGEGYLYTLQVETLADDGAVEDVYRLPVGIRTVKIEGGSFLINGEPFYFKGFGKHEDMDVKGKGLDDAMNVKDLNLLKWIGANSFRTSHYPYSEEIMNLADELGFVVIDESPAVGLYQFKQKSDVFTPEHVAKLLEHHVEVMRELVQRDKNHPSVVMWSVANEAASQEESFRDYWREVFDVTREADPAERPVTIVVHTWYDNDLAVGHADVICLNRYWGWYGQTGELDMIEGKAEAELPRWFEHQKKPMILSEYGADTIPGFHSDPPVVFTEEYQWEMIRRINNVLDRLDFVIGEHVWNFADFMTKQGITRVMGNRKGVFTRQRQPKMVAHKLRERWTAVGLTERPKPQA